MIFRLFSKQKPGSVPHSQAEPAAAPSMNLFKKETRKAGEKTECGD
jgi:hypothetical protein